MSVARNVHLAILVVNNTEQHAIGLYSLDITYH